MTAWTAERDVRIELKGRLTAVNFSSETQSINAAQHVLCMSGPWSHGGCIAHIIKMSGWRPPEGRLRSME